MRLITLALFLMLSFEVYGQEEIDVDISGLWTGSTMCPAGKVYYTLRIDGKAGTYSHSGYGPEKKYPIDLEIKVSFRKGWEGVWVSLDPLDPEYKGAFRYLHALLHENREILEVRPHSGIGDCKGYKLKKSKLTSGNEAPLALKKSFDIYLDIVKEGRDRNLKIFLGSPSDRMERLEEIQNLVSSFYKARDGGIHFYQDEAKLYFAVGDEIVHESKVFKRHRWKYQPRLLALINSAHPRDRVNFRETEIHAWDVEMIENIYYGNFEARSSREPGKTARVLHNYYLSEYSKRAREFLPKNKVRVEYSRTTTTRDGYGRVRGQNSTDYFVDMEPRYAENFRRWINIRGPVTFRVGDSAAVVAHIYRPESRAQQRFRENIFRHSRGLAPLDIDFKALQRPNFSLPLGRLDRSNTYNLYSSGAKGETNFFYQVHLGQSMPSNAKHDRKAAQKAGIEQAEVMECYYVTNRNGKDRYHRIFFWHKSEPKKFDQLMAKLNPGNVLLTYVGPPVRTPPATLSEAINLTLDYFYP
ncbi:MAG: hypothetical protein QNK37_04765 [Acidobacteriota bacterium]|nr:hypothetical protein [Acidobacteriota bacterium]